MEDLLRRQGRRTVSRDELRRSHPRLDEVSPQVGALDPAALAGALQADMDEGVSMLVDLARATDPALRAEVRRVAASLLIPAARAAGSPSAGGAVRIGPVRNGGLDLDLDATLERLGDHPELTEEDLRWRGWRRPGRAVVLVVDASGSVSGLPLNAAVVTAAALAARSEANDQLGVVAFWSRSVILRHLRDPSTPASVIEKLLALRGGDTTDLAGGMRAALGQAALSVAARRDIVLLTDGMANEGDDPLSVASSCVGAGAVLHVLALSDDPEAAAACAALASAGGGRVAALRRAADAPRAVADVLGR